jgi:similar to stage IV sporulation protein
MLFSLITIIVIYLCSNLFIREITFENNLYYDYDIYQSVKSHLNKVGILYQLDDNINNINRELSITYPHYAYVGIKKVGSKIVIEIVNNTISSNENNIKKDPGDMVSMYDGYIVDVITQSGVVTVGTSQYVKKGDLLISGNLNYYNNINDQSNYVYPSGIILGKTIIYEKVIVKKESVVTIYNGECSSYYLLDIFGTKYNINKNNSQNIGYSNITNIIKLGSIFNISKIIEYHTEEISIIYTKEEAIKYAKSKIIHNFNKMKINEIECIESLDLLSVTDIGYAFEITYITKYIRNFCMFQKKALV